MHCLCILSQAFLIIIYLCNSLANFLMTNTKSQWPSARPTNESNLKLGHLGDEPKMLRTFLKSQQQENILNARALKFLFMRFSKLCRTILPWEDVKYMKLQKKGFFLEKVIWVGNWAYKWKVASSLSLSVYLPKILLPRLKYYICKKCPCEKKLSKLSDICGVQNNL